MDNVSSLEAPGSSVHLFFDYLQVQVSPLDDMVADCDICIDTISALEPSVVDQWSARQRGKHSRLTYGDGSI